MPRDERRLRCLISNLIELIDSKEGFHGRSCLTPRRNFPMTFSFDKDISMDRSYLPATLLPAIPRSASNRVPKPLKSIGR